MVDSQMSGHAGNVDPAVAPGHGQAESLIVAAVLDMAARTPPESGDPAREPDALVGFCRSLLKRVASTELSMTDPDGVAPGILGAFDLLANHSPDGVDVRVEPIDSSIFGPEGGSTAVQVAMTDRPLVFSTVLATLERQGLTAQRFSHPIMGVQRDPARRIRAIGSAFGAADQEVLVHVEVAEALDAGERKLVTEAVVDAIDDLLLAAGDRAAMQEVLTDTAARLERSGPGLFDAADCAEAAAFCRWLVGENFLFMGSMHDPADGSLGVCTPSGDRLAPLAPAATFLSRPLFIRRSRLTSTISRAERMAELLVADIDEKNGLRGTLVVLGLTTLRGRSERPSGTPWVRAKLSATLEQERIIGGSHDETMIRALFDGLPWDVLLAADDDWIHDTLVALIQAQQTGRTLIRLLDEPDADALTVLVGVPQEDVRTTMSADIGELLRTLLQPGSLEMEVELGNSGMTMLSYVACLGPGDLARIDREEVVREVTESCRSWSERLTRELGLAVGGSAAGVAQRWLGRLPAAYREATTPQQAAADLVDLDGMDDSGSVVLRFLPHEQDDWHHLRVVVAGAPLELSRFIPVLESVGLVVAEEMAFVLGGPGTGPSEEPDGEQASVLDLLVGGRSALPDPGTDRREMDGERLARAVLACWTGRADVDRLNELVLTAGMEWNQVGVLRAYARYLSQLSTGTRPSTLFAALADNPAAARSLWDRFRSRFEPAEPEGTDQAEWDQPSRDAVLACCDDVARLDQDRLLRRLLGLVDATVRTNIWAVSRTDAVAISLDGEHIPGQARAVSWREIWVSAPDVEGVHLRAGPVARGGVRWSDREGDARTEVLQLMQAQELKNAVIVPTGAKGGFVLRRRPERSADLPGAVRDAYSTFVRSLLDVTDDLVDGATVRPPGVRAADGTDAYLVVAADRGTATFSDLANSFSQDRGFWLDDAFASGGSDGYDHKALGVTARGAWVSVTEHFGRLGLDVATDPFRVIGVGDMSGDVFGNGMLLSRSIRLVAAFDHRHVFLDPYPDPDRSWAERRRLFDLPSSSWDDYDRSVLGTGGMIVARSTKRVRLTPQVRDLLAADHDELSMPELIRTVLGAPADLLYFGGIGTYVKASTESMGSVGDPLNDEVRVAASDLRVRVVGEGANLGMTPAARVEFASRDGLINSDAIDNSAGVDSSDREVNLKILLAVEERGGRIDRAERNMLLDDVVEDVVGAVLGNVAKQNRALTRGVTQSRVELEQYLALLFDLEAGGAVDRDTHALPSGTEVRYRREDELGLYRPELAVLMAATKDWLAREALESDLPDREPLGELADRYFPAVLSSRFPEAVRAHPLRREIVASRLANELVDRMGCTWVPELVRRSGQGPVAAMAAYWMARKTARIGLWWLAIDSAELQERDALWDPAGEVIDALAGDYLRRGIAQTWQWAEIERNAAAGTVLARLRSDGARAEDATRPGEHPGERAERLRRLALAPSLAEVAERAGVAPEVAVAPFLDAGRRFGLDRLTLAVLACSLNATDTWSQRHRESLLFDLDRLRRAAASVLIGGVALAELDGRLDRMQPRVDEAIEMATDRLDALAVVVAELWLLVEEEAGGIPRA